MTDDPNTGIEADTTPDAANTPGQDGGIKRGSIADDIPQPAVADEDADANQDDTGHEIENTPGPDNGTTDGGTDIPGIMPDQPVMSR